MPKFTFRISKYNNHHELLDDFKEWISARDKFDAQTQIEKAYPYKMGYECILTEIDD